MTQNPDQWTSFPILPPCKVKEIFGYTGVEYQLGSVVRSPEQVNYAQYNQGFRNKQNFYIQNPQNLFEQQTTPPSYATNQRVTQKSSLELLLEFFFINQSKQLQELKNQIGFLTDSLVKLSSKVDYFLCSQQMLETQISQVVQQVASSSHLRNLSEPTRS